jgi:cysteine-rich repeat protein
MRRQILIGLAVCAFVARAAAVHASANIIPDHIYRLGNCAPGQRCNWGAGLGPSCLVPDCTPECAQLCQQENGICALSASDSFAGVLEITVDEQLCSEPNGAVVTFALAGTATDGTPFQLADKVLDLCDYPVACTGRNNRQCSVCGGNTDCSGGSAGGSECAPGAAVFFCKDPCFDPVSPYFEEADLTNGDQRMLGWMQEARQPLLQIIRNELQSVFPNAVGPAVIVDAQQPAPATEGPPAKARFCIKVWFLDEEKPLGACSNDATVFCTSNADCGEASVCQSGAPPEINPPDFTTRVSGRTCDSGDRSDKPCAGNTDCSGGGECVDTAATATLTGCPSSLCGDGLRDPGESCDDQNNADGDGCSAACAIETCWACTGRLGELSSCTALGAGASCSIDENDCTIEECDGSGQCAVVSSVTACSNGDACCPAGCSALNDSDCFGCPGAPDPACTPFAKGSLQVDERTAGREKLIVKWQQGPALAPSAFGDPVAGQTAYAVCLYDDDGARVATYVVDRAGDTCDTKPCWKGLGKPAGTTGYQYTDQALAAGGMQRMSLKPNATAGKSQALAKGNGAGLADGVAAALQGSTAATAQLRGSDSPACASAVLSNVVVNDGGLFKTKSP